MKKWGFKGQGASHGNSKAHRKIGAIGQRTNQSKVAKGKKMPGRLGGKNQTIFNLRIVRIDSPRSLLYLKGTIPGPIGGCLCIVDAQRMALNQYGSLSYPTFVPNPGVVYPDIEDVKPSENDPSERVIEEKIVPESSDEEGEKDDKDIVAEKKTKK